MDFVLHLPACEETTSRIVIAPQVESLADLRSMPSPEDLN